VDDIIDLGEYLRRREETEKAPRTAFAVWGGDGERARFALPLWRIVYLAGGARGGLVWVKASEDKPLRLNPFVVLDLAQDPARTHFQPQVIQGLEGTAAPTLRATATEGSLAIHLGEHDGRRWFLVVDEATKDQSSLDGRVRDDILFLSGECAGLLFFRGFANEAGEPT
jgi:hypothetical protein